MKELVNVPAEKVFAALVRMVNGELPVTSTLVTFADKVVFVHLEVDGEGSPFQLCLRNDGTWDVTLAVETGQDIAPPSSGRNRTVDQSYMMP